MSVAARVVAVALEAVAAAVVASYFVVENIEAGSAERTAVVAESCLVCGNSADDLCYLGTENLGSASLTDYRRRRASLRC